MQNENNIFEGIPSLGDTQGLENFLNQQAANQVAPETEIPPMLQQNQGQPAVQPAQPVQFNQPAQDPNQVANQGQGQPQVQPQVYTIGGNQYTAAQLEQIIAQNNAMRQQMAGQRMPNASQVQSQGNKSTYTPEQSAIIKQLIDRGVPMERIQAAMQQNNAQAQMNARLTSIEDAIRQEAYAREERAFIEKMTAFGDKFGLSENDLVEFSNVAMSKGINVANVTDVEAVFRAIYPEQYAIRLQRMSTQPASQMYGGSSIPEMPRANASKMEDAYVEAFLKGAMPNQYSKK